MRHGKAHDAGTQARPDETNQNPGRTNQQGNGDTEAIGDLAHVDTAHTEPNHHQGIGQCGIGTRNTELGLHFGQNNRHDKHTTAAHQHRQQGNH